MLAMAVPGLGALLAEEIDDLGGATVRDSGFDGRSDVVLFDVRRGHHGGVAGLVLAEDVFVEVGRTPRADGDDPRRIADRVWGVERVERALSVWAASAGGLRASMTYRVIARVLQERSFLRTDLRRELTRTIQARRPRWRVEDPARLEVWAVEYRPGQVVAGLRVSDAHMRQHRGRAAERPGALRPTVAAAMVRQAGPGPGVLFDPCCGSGTVLAEAVAAGWTARGADIDRAAIETARHNVPAATVETGDVRHIELPDASVDACVSNLPFGQRYAVQGDMRVWLRIALDEMARVTRAGGRVVLLAPEIPRVALPTGIRQTGSHKLRLLGTWTRMWCYERT